MISQNDTDATHQGKADDATKLQSHQFNEAKKGSLWKHLSVPAVIRSALLPYTPPERRKVPEVAKPHKNFVMGQDHRLHALAHPQAVSIQKEIQL